MYMCDCHGLNSMHCCLGYRWDKYVISVREAKALPKSNCWEWRSNFLYVEGNLTFLLTESFLDSKYHCHFSSLTFYCGYTHWTLY